ncbi:hypothetical protein UM582_07705 [Staphylococcus aureus]|nr:hypothetical protein UM582_07705 [Staphylococcus aureus]
MLLINLVASKLLMSGLILDVVGSLLIIITPLPAFLIIGRIIQGLSAACIMPSTLAIINEYYIGTRTTCLKLLVYWFLGW